MIDLNRLRQHSASQLAAQWLKNLKEPETSTPPILRLALVYLEQVDADNTPQNYLADLKQEVYRLMCQPTARVLELFSSDWESLQAELEANSDQEQKILEEHLDSPHQEMATAKTLREVGSLLAENLMDSLCHLYPGFGRQNS